MTLLSEPEPAYTYSHSKGLFVGVSLDGSAITVRHDVNAAFYGYEVPVSVILEGGVERPAAAAVLYEALDDVVKAAARRPRSNPSSTFGSAFSNQSSTFGSAFSNPSNPSSSGGGSGSRPQGGDRSAAGQGGVMFRAPARGQSANPFQSTSSSPASSSQTPQSHSVAAAPAAPAYNPFVEPSAQKQRQPSAAPQAPNSQPRVQYQSKLLTTTRPAHSRPVARTVSQSSKQPTPATGPPKTQPVNADYEAKPQDASAFAIDDSDEEGEQFTV